jgi:hypothetical protein
VFDDFETGRLRLSRRGLRWPNAKTTLWQDARTPSAALARDRDDDRERANSLDEADHVHFRRCTIARPITQSLSLSLRKLSSSVKWLMRNVIVGAMSLGLTASRFITERLIES